MGKKDKKVQAVSEVRDAVASPSEMVEHPNAAADYVEPPHADVVPVHRWLEPILGHNRAHLFAVDSVTSLCGEARIGTACDVTHLSELDHGRCRECKEKEARTQ